jgi:hypothetical protein
MSEVSDRRLNQRSDVRGRRSAIKPEVGCQRSVVSEDQRQKKFEPQRLCVSYEPWCAKNYIFFGKIFSIERINHTRLILAD